MKHAVLDRNIQILADKHAPPTKIQISHGESVHDAGFSQIKVTTCLI